LCKTKKKYNKRERDLEIDTPKERQRETQRERQRETQRERQRGTERDKREIERDKR